jgi:signal transduction histidine kinase
MRERGFSAVIILLAAAVVIVLGVLQYRWSNQVSEATSIRLADSLQMSMINWHLDFFRAFSEACVALRVDSGPSTQENWTEYARRYGEWKKTTAYPNLVAGLYALETDPAMHLLRLSPSSQRFQTADLPSNFRELAAELRPSASKPSAGEATSSTRQTTGGTPQFANGEFESRFYGGGQLAAWKFEPHLPALVREAPARGAKAWIVLVLDRDEVRAHLLPALAQRYFRGTEGLDYQVAVTAGKQGGGALYSSDSGFGETEINDADGTMNIFGRMRADGKGSPIRIFHVPSPDNVPAASVGVTWFPLLRDDGPDQDWRLIVRHRRGGALGAFIADSRRRDLLIGFGVLFLLVVSMAILIVTSTRAQRLAKLQMDFVTAVSHELRTPLTVISSAAENIAHGVVEGKAQLEQYGAVIGGQARKLFEMVEQILLFAAIREGKQRYTLRPLEVGEILDAALSSTAGLIRASGFHVERFVESQLPPIVGDLPALSQCVQNLITNALKYGSEQRWIGIEARLAEHGLTGKEIQISVSDRGIGIAAEELRHIFEPFYRSPSVAAAQIHGTGLGLPLAKSIVQAMKGQITVKSAPGRGSTFTLHLPFSESVIRQPAAKQREAVTS